MSLAFYPADLLLPPVTAYRTAISMLLLLLAGIIALCYLRKVLRNAARVPDPLSHPIYDVGGPIALPSFDLGIAVQVLESYLAAGPLAATLKKALKALARVRLSIANDILIELLDYRAVIRQALIIDADPRSSLKTALHSLIPSPSPRPSLPMR